MQKLIPVVIATALFATTIGFAKDKTKNQVPSYVISAQTVAVVIDPKAGVTIDDPRANEVAQKDVETALSNWGRFRVTTGTPGADLIIVVRRGRGKLVDETIGDPRQNNRPGVINPTNDGIMIGAQQGRQPRLSSDTTMGSADGRPHTQTEIGGEEDSFLVFRGDVENPLDGVPAWRYMAKDGLHPHNVPAVEEFRKAIVETEKAATKKP